MPMTSKKLPIVISLGGSVMVPDEIDVSFLKKFRNLILEYVKRGQRFIIIVGGGKICRRYQRAAREVAKLADVDVDWLGIHSTRLNAHLLRTIFRSHAYAKIISNPNDINTRISKPIIIGAGFRPGSSTDYRAVQLAHAYGAKTILNLSNISWVYTKDPHKYKTAKKLENMTWKEFRKLVGNDWDPGANIPFDPVASKWADAWGLRVVISRGTDIANTQKILDGKKARGTIIE